MKGKGSLRVYREFSVENDPTCVAHGNTIARYLDSPEVRDINHQWLKTVVKIAEMESFAELHKMLHVNRRNWIADILNHSRNIIVKVFSFTASDKQSAFSARATQCLYNRILQSILSDSSDKSAVLHDESFQTALIVVSLEIVNYCLLQNADEAFPYLTIKVNALHLSLDIWNATRLFKHYIGKSSKCSTWPTLPSFIATGYIPEIQQSIEALYAWMPRSSLYLYVGSLHSHGVSANIRVARMLNDFYSSVCVLAQAFSVDICAVLSKEFANLSSIPQFAERTSCIMRYLLLKSIDLIFGRHLALIIACCAFFLARLHGIEPPPKFRGIAQTLSKAFPNVSIDNFQDLEWIEEGEQVRGRGSAREFYNTCFLRRAEMWDPKEVFRGFNKAQEKASGKDRVALSNLN